MYIRSPQWGVRRSAHKRSWRFSILSWNCYAYARLSYKRRVRLSVLPSVCLSHADIDSKLLTAGLCGIYLRVAMEFSLWDQILYHRSQRNTFSVAQRHRTLVFDRRAFAVLRSTCSWRVTTYVGKPSAVGQPTRPTQPFILSESINEE